MTTNERVIGSESRVLLEVTYDNMIFASQNAVWSFLRNACETGFTRYHDNASKLFKTKNVLMGKPESLARGIGFPYVIVPPPKVDENFYSFGHKQIMLSFDLEIWLRDTETMQFVDFIRKTLHDKESFFSGNLALERFINNGSGVEEVDLPNGQAVYLYRLTVVYEWFGVA